MNSKEILVSADEITRYEEAVNNVLRGAMDPERFMAFRLQHGIYGQRQDGYQMVRVKIPGGRLTPNQLAAVGHVLREYSEDHAASVTTRQDIQFHFVRLADTPQIMRVLGEAGLTTREACGNTVRNITACPLAGVCPSEHTDIGTFVDGAVAHFLRHPLAQHMPRKFKMSFSGCQRDCAMAMMHDVGVVATTQGDDYGFRILAGGGLGHKPHEAIVIEDFIGPHELLPCLEAVIALHNRHSDRKRRAKARIKFLVDKFGIEGFRSRYREELQRTKAAQIDSPTPAGSWAPGSEITNWSAGAPRKVTAQKQPGLYIVPISLPTGDITAAQLEGLARLAEQEGLHDIRTTADQNLMLVGVPAQQLDAVHSGIAALGLRAPQTGDDVVSCPGTTTCRLGITASKRLAAQLTGGPADLRVRVSGCHNSCGQHHVADIGVHGEGKRVHGKLIPCYAMHLGGSGLAGGAISLKGPVIPAIRVEQAIERVQNTYLEREDSQVGFFEWARAKGEPYFEALLADLTEVSVHEVPFLAREPYETDAFQVLQLGGGECAGAAQDKVASAFSEAQHERTYRNAFALQRKFAEASECAEQVFRSVATATLFLAARAASATIDEMATALTESLPHSDLGPSLAQLAAQLREIPPDCDPESFMAFARRQDAWTVEAGRLCQTMDAQLDLATSLPQLAAPSKETATVVDLSPYACPLHYIKARNELRKVAPGGVVEFIVMPGEPLQQVSSSLADDGHEIIAVEEARAPGLLKVRRSSQAL